MTDFGYTTRATQTIEIMYYTDLWGVYSFDFSNALPTGDIISAVTVKAYIGNVRIEATLVNSPIYPQTSLIPPMSRK